MMLMMLIDDDDENAGDDGDDDGGADGDDDETTIPVGYDIVYPTTTKEATSSQKLRGRPRLPKKDLGLHCSEEERKHDASEKENLN